MRRGSDSYLGYRQAPDGAPVGGCAPIPALFAMLGVCQFPAPRNRRDENPARLLPLFAAAAISVNRLAAATDVTQLSRHAW